MSYALTIDFKVENIIGVIPENNTFVISTGLHQCPCYYLTLTPNDFHHELHRYLDAIEQVDNYAYNDLLARYYGN